MLAPQRPTALVVEDEALIALDLVRCLEEIGFDVVATVDTGGAAVRAADERRPDVVLMDIHLKGAIDGIATAVVLRERFAVPVVFVTAWADPQTVARAAASNPYGYIVKPFTQAEVRCAVEIARHRHEADRLIAERERWFSTTLRSISDAVVACDEQGRVRFVNHAAEQLVGWSEQSATGVPITDVVRVVGDAGDVANPAISALRDRTPQSTSRTASLLDREGERARLIEQAAAPILHGDELLGAVLVFRDVTDARRMQEQLALTDRLTSLGTMAASVGHEINNPLSYNLGNLDFALARLRELQGGTPELAEIVAVLEEARAGGHRIAAIVRDLRAFSRTQEGLHREVDVRSCVEWALRLTANQVRHAAKLVTQLERVPAVLGNEVRLSQVFVNLLVNASQAIVGPSDRNEIRVVTRTDARDRAVVEIHDTGPGMAPEAALRIFDRYSTTKPADGAAALGLAICRDIVDWMGGELEVDSERGRGSCFRVVLPIGATPRERTRLKMSESPTPRSLRILVIEDDQLLGRALGRMLMHGHRVVVVEGGEQGLALLADDPSFDLVLCDMMMPQTSGMDVYDRLLARNPELARRMVFMTGGAFTPRAAEFVATVPNPTISKPFTRDDLLATLYARHAELDAAGPAAPC